MKRDYPIPPVGGACTQTEDQHIFTNPQNPSDITAAKRICSTCPIRNECAEWAQKMIEEDNRGRPDHAPQRTPLHGVVAGEHYRATDTEGRTINMARIVNKIDSRLLA